MKIQKSRVFIADLYAVNSFSKNVFVSFDGCEFGNMEYTEDLYQPNVKVIKFNNGYVLADQVKNSYDYFVSKATAIKYPSSLLRTQPDIFSGNGYLFLKNVKPLFNEKGKISLNEIAKIQIKQAAEDNNIESNCE